MYPPVASNVAEKSPNSMKICGWWKQPAKDLFKENNPI